MKTKLCKKIVKKAKINGVKCYLRKFFFADPEQPLFYEITASDGSFYKTQDTNEAIERFSLLVEFQKKAITDMSMKRILKRVTNTNTGKVVYEGVLAYGDEDDLYTKLWIFAREFMHRHKYDSTVYIYGTYIAHYWRLGMPKKLRKVFGHYYFSYMESSYNYVFIIQ